MSKAHLGTYLRTQPTWESYRNAPNRYDEECFLCDRETIECFTHWYITVNDYPYDAVASSHNMLVPIDYVSEENQLTTGAKRELELIFNRLNEAGEYDCILRNFTVGQTHPVHLHYHLIKWKRHGA